MTSYFPFLWAYSLSAMVALGLFVGGWGLWAGVFILAVMHPLLDFFCGDVKSKPVSQSHWLGQILLVGILPMEIALLIWALFIQQSWSGSAWWLAALSVGVITGGLGITAAHELIHRPKKWERLVGSALLVLVNYGHFRIEHVYGHHMRVATPEDPATARKGEWLYPFWFRSLFGGLVSAWKLERRRTQRQSKTFWHNRVFWHIFSQFNVGCGLAFTMGSKAVGFWFAQSLFAVLLLETINYVEHYGLLRNKTGQGYEAVKPRHSWDTRFNFTNWTLFNLGLHGHHHAKASVPYYKLQPSESSPQHPMGYSSLILLALFPPLWFWRIHSWMTKIRPEAGQ